MAFDPDAYLAEKQSFDPDAYLGTKQKKEFKASNILAPVIAPLEVGAQMATGLAGQFAGGVRGLYNLATGEGLDASANAVRKTQDAMTYQPRLPLSKGLGEAVAYPFQKAMEATKTAGGHIGEKIAGDQGRLAGEAIGEQIIPVVGTIVPGMQARNAIRRGPSVAAQSAKIEAQQRAAPKIAVAREGAAKGFKFDVNEVNPDAPFGARVAAGPKLDRIISEKNLVAAQNELKKVIGLSTDDQLNRSAIQSRIDNLGEAYEVIRELGPLKSNAGLADKLRAAMVEEIPGREAAAAVANRVVSDTADIIASGGLTGDSAISRIKDYRKSARKIKDSNAATEADLMKADAYMDVANMLENVVEASITDKTILSNFRKAREGIAKAYTVEKITNPVTGTPSLSMLTSGKLADAPLTGELAFLRRLAQTFPESVANISKHGEIVTTLPRTSVAGTLGAASGAVAGNTGLGATIGAVTGVIGDKILRNRTMTPEYQSANLFPDFAKYVHPDANGQLRIQSPLTQSNVAPQGLGFAPAGTIVDTQSLPPPTTRGLLSLADDQPTQGAGLQMPSVNYQMQPKLGPLYSMRQRQSGMQLVPDEAYPSSLKMPEVEINAPATRGMLSLADDSRPIPDTQRLATRHDVPTVEFPLRQEVLQNPEIVKATQAFIGEAERLRELIQKSQGMWKDRYRQELTALENEFGAGMRQLGIDNTQDAVGALTKLYSSGQPTKLPIQTSGRGGLEIIGDSLSHPTQAPSSLR